MPGPPPYLCLPLFFHPHRESLRPNSPHASVGADSISIRPHTFISISHFPATPPRRGGALLRPRLLPLYDLLPPYVASLYSLYARTARGISPALKTARGAVFAPRYADAWPGLFDSRTPLLLNMYNKKKKAQPLAKLSFLVTRASISRGLKNNPQDCFLPPAGGRPVRFLARKHQKNSPA